jgi:hypothetical protein
VTILVSELTIDIINLVILSMMMKNVRKPIWKQTPVRLSEMWKMSSRVMGVVDRATVTKIVRSDQVGDYICKLKERFYGLGDDALDAVQHALREQKDARLGFQLLATIGAVPSAMELERLQTVQATSDEEGAVREMGLRLLGCAMERARVYGHDLPELKEDLRKVGGRFNRKTGKIEPLSEEDCEQLS